MIRNKISIVSNKSDNCKIESLITLESHIKIDNAEILRYKCIIILGFHMLKSVFVSTLTFRRK